MFQQKRIKTTLKDRFLKFKKFFFPPPQNHYFKLGLFSALTVFLMLLIGWQAYSLTRQTQFSKFIPSFFTKEIKTDEHNHTNILLAGVGGIMHEGGELTDTLMVVSLDHNQHFTSLLSIPRDLYIKNSNLNTRINSIYAIYRNKNDSENEGMEALAGVVSEYLQIPIHYYAKIDFNGFIKAIDIIGGIDVNLTNAFYDPLYPKEGTIYYETFSLPVGKNHLDGETALKYVRSRHSTSDFSRSERQQAVISLVKDKILSLGVLGSPSKINKLLNNFTDNLSTNLSLKEILYLAKIANRFDRQKIQSAVLNNEPVYLAGFLYTPPQEEYRGSYVLIPYDKKELADFSDFFLMHPDLFQTKTSIQILNAGGVVNAATATKRMLTRHGFNVIRFGNGKKSQKPQTIIYYLSKEKPETVAMLAKYFPMAVISNTVPPEYLEPPYLSGAEIIIELGKDFFEYKQNNKNRFIY